MRCRRHIELGKTRLWLLMVTLTNLFSTAVAIAGPPNPNIRKNPPAWVGFAVMAILVGVVIFISLLPSKRSHQD
ncbi:MAG: hypothetical protein AAF432_05870 [Planctomycetota bacterium]